MSSRARPFTEKPWPNAMPARGATPLQLATFWADLNGASSASSMETLRGRTCAAVHATLHRILAPSAPHICGHECAHVAAGATPAQCKRFLDAIDAEDARLAAAAAVPFDIDDPYFDDQRILWAWRRHFAALIGAAAAPPPAHGFKEQLRAETQTESSTRPAWRRRGARGFFEKDEDPPPSDRWVIYSHGMSRAEEQAELKKLRSGSGQAEFDFKAPPDEVALAPVPAERPPAATPPKPKRLLFNGWPVSDFNLDLQAFLRKSCPRVVVYGLDESRPVPKPAPAPIKLGVLPEVPWPKDEPALTREEARAASLVRRWQAGEIKAASPADPPPNYRQRRPVMPEVPYPNAPSSPAPAGKGWPLWPLPFVLMAIMASPLLLVHYVSPWAGLGLMVALMSCLYLPERRRFTPR